MTARRVRKPAHRVRTPANKATPGHRSFSQISKYLNCGHQYKLHYVDKIPIHGVNVNFAVGSHGHKYIEEVLSFRINGKDLTAKQREECLHSHSIAMGKEIKEKIEEFNKELLPGIVPLKAPVMQLRQILERLLKQWNLDVLPEIDPIAVEKRLEIEIDGETVLMFIDLIQRRNRGDAILDWKFTKKAKGKRAASDSLQLSLYAMATGIMDVGFGALVKPQDGKESKWKPRIAIDRTIKTSADLEHAQNVFIDAMRGIRAGYFPKCSPENFLCGANWCDYWPICRGKNQPKEPDWM
jgi:hypothetical protein